MHAKGSVQFTSLYSAFRQQLLSFILFCRRIELDVSSWASILTVTV